MRSVLLALIVKTFLRPAVSGVQQNAFVSSCFTMTTMHQHVSHGSNETKVLNLKEKNRKQTRDLTEESCLPSQVFYCEREIQKSWNEPWIYNGLIDHPRRFIDIIATKRIVNETSRFISIFTRTESMWTKLLLLFTLRVFLKSNIATELNILSLIFVQMGPSFVTSVASPLSLMMSSGQVIEGHRSNNVNSVQSIWSTNKEMLAQKLPSESKSELYKRGECDLGWYQYGSYCYRPSREEKMFDHAQRACQYHKANLVSILNKEENEIMFNISKDFLGLPRKRFIWLGMERREASNRLHWIDDSNVAYENWILGEPDRNGACVQMINKGLWEDTNCLQKQPFICKKVSSIPPPYSRSTELGILIGIPFSFAFIVLSCVGILLVKSIRDADDTFFGYGKNRNKEKMHAALVDLTASIAHVSTGEFNYPERRVITPRRGLSRSTSRSHSVSSSHVNPAIEVSEVGSQSPIPRRKVSENGHIKVEEENAKGKTDPEEIEVQVYVSTGSIDREQPQFELATSLDQLVNLQPKSRRIRGVLKPEAANNRDAEKDHAYRRTTYV